MNDKLNEMWTALAAYQPKADANGHGESWALMCSERTSDAAYDAAGYAAEYAAYFANAGYAANAAYDAAYANYTAAKYAQRSIKRITKAQKETE
mgnify:CR=1 FL=1